MSKMPLGIFLLRPLLSLPSSPTPTVSQTASRPPHQSASSPAPNKPWRSAAAVSADSASNRRWAPFSAPKPHLPRLIPNAPKLPEPVSALFGKRLDLHKKTLKLVRENDLEEAALFTKHSVYSNCRPTIYTVNAVLTAQLRQSKYGDLLTLHRFINNAGIAPTVGTYNLLF